MVVAIHTDFCESDNLKNKLLAMVEIRDGSNHYEPDTVTAISDKCRVCYKNMFKLVKRTNGVGIKS